MQRDQEEVRRRFAMISYSDPLIWEKGTGESQDPDGHLHSIRERVTQVVISCVFGSISPLCPWRDRQVCALHFVCGFHQMAAVLNVLCLADAQRNITSSRPASPQPIRLTKPVLNAPCTGRHPPAEASGDWVSDYLLILECIDSLYARNIWISHNWICLQLNCRGTAHWPGCICTAISVCLGNIQ